MKTICKKMMMLAAATLPLLSCTTPAPQAQEELLDAAVYEALPFDMPKVIQPSFADNQASIVDFGAKGDGVTLNTEAFNNAIKAVNEKGGGRVVVPAGVWLTGPIQLLSNVNLHTEKNALVVFTDDFSAYPIIETSFEGLETRRCQSPLWARGQENIAITGEGIFDGRGDSWRPVKKSKLTEAQWKGQLKKGGVVENDVWYTNAWSLKGANACKNFNVP